jgi:hypothetical protein
MMPWHAVRPPERAWRRHSRTNAPIHHCARHQKRAAARVKEVVICCEWRLSECPRRVVRIMIWLLACFLFGFLHADPNNVIAE